MDIKFFFISLVFLTIVCLCQSQISFSTDWSGGKRSAIASHEFRRLNTMNKRKPGWGKRSESKFKFYLKINSFCQFKMTFFK